VSARQGKAGGGAVAREVADASSVAFEGRTDAVSAGIAHDEGDAALSELKGRRAAALGRAARLRRASGTASRDAFGESDEELGTDALSGPASMASRPMLARARRASLATGAIVRGPGRPAERDCRDCRGTRECAEEVEGDGCFLSIRSER